MAHNGQMEQDSLPHADEAGPGAGALTSIPHGANTLAHLPALALDHASALYEALRQEMAHRVSMGQDQPQRESDEYPHYHALASATPLPGSPPDDSDRTTDVNAQHEDAVMQGYAWPTTQSDTGNLDSELDELGVEYQLEQETRQLDEDGDEGVQEVFQQAQQKHGLPVELQTNLADPALGTSTTKDPGPLGAELIAMPGEPALHHLSASHPQSAAGPPATSTPRRRTRPEVTANPAEYAGGLIERVKNATGAVPRSQLPAASDMTPIQLKEYIKLLDVPAILGNAQPGQAAPAASAPEQEGDTEQQAQAPTPPPMRPRRYHVERKRRIPELRARIEQLNKEREALYAALRTHLISSGAADAEVAAAPVTQDDSSLPTTTVKERPRVPVRAYTVMGLVAPDFHEEEKTSTASNTGNETKPEGPGSQTGQAESGAGATAGPSRSSNRTSSFDTDSDPGSTTSTRGHEHDYSYEGEEGDSHESELEQLYADLEVITEELAHLGSTLARLEAVTDPAMPLSLQLGKNRSLGRGKPDDELWSESVGRAPGVRRYSAYGNPYDLERHVLSPAMSECSEVPTISRRSSLSGVSLLSTSPSLRSPASQLSVASSTHLSARSGALRRESRSILGILSEEASHSSQGQTPIDGSNGVEAASKGATEYLKEQKEAGSPDKESWQKDVERWTRTASPKIASGARPRSAPSSHHPLGAQPSDQPFQATPSPRSQPTGTSLSRVRPRSGSSGADTASSTVSFAITVDPSIHEAATSDVDGRIAHARQQQRHAYEQLHQQPSQAHRKPPVAGKTRLGLVQSSRYADERTARVSASTEMQLAASQADTAPHSPHIEEAPSALPTLQTTTEGLRPHRRLSTSPPDTPPPYSPRFIDFDNVPEIIIDSPTSPARTLSSGAVAQSPSSQVRRGSSSPGQPRQQRSSPTSARPAAGFDCQNAAGQMSQSRLRKPVQPPTEKEVLRAAKEAERQRVWADRTAHIALRERFLEAKDALCLRMYQTKDDGIKSRYHWELAELYIRQAETLGTPAGAQGTKLMQECLQRYEACKNDAVKWARYGQMHLWLRRNSVANGQGGGGDQHLGIACNAFDQVARLAGDKSELAGHCAMLAGTALQENVRGPKQWHQAQQYWLRSVEAACPQGLDERYVSLANACDILALSIVNGKYEGDSQAWRAHSIEAITRATALNPEKEDWRVRKRYYEACKADEEKKRLQMAGSGDSTGETVEERQEGDEGREAPISAEDTAEDNRRLPEVPQTERTVLSDPASDADAIREALRGPAEEPAEDGLLEAPAEGLAVEGEDWVSSPLSMHSNLPDEEEAATEGAEEVTGISGQAIDAVSSSAAGPPELAGAHTTPRTSLLPFENEILDDSPPFGAGNGDVEQSRRQFKPSESRSPVPSHHDRLVAPNGLVVRSPSGRSLPDDLSRRRSGHSGGVSGSPSGEHHQREPPLANVDPTFLLETLKEHHRALLQTNDALSALTESIRGLQTQRDTDVQELRQEIHGVREDVGRELGTERERTSARERIHDAGIVELERLVRGLQEVLERAESSAVALAGPQEEHASHDADHLRDQHHRAALSRLEDHGEGPLPRPVQAGHGGVVFPVVAQHLLRSRSVPPPTSYGLPARFSVYSQTTQLSDDPPPSFHSRQHSQPTSQPPIRQGEPGSEQPRGGERDVSDARDDFPTAAAAVELDRAGSTPPRQASGLPAPSGRERSRSDHASRGSLSSPSSGRRPLVPVEELSEAEKTAWLEKGAYLFGMYALKKLASGSVPSA